MKNHNEMLEILYISLKMKEADNKKYFLIKNLYELSNITYGKSSRESDYIIQDRLKNVVDELNRYYNHIRLFDNGKNGDSKAFEDILVFFQNSFCDSFLLDNKIEILKDAIRVYKTEDKEQNKTQLTRQIEKNSSSNIIELEGKIRKLEIILSHQIVPRLYEFLDDVNHIFFCANMQSLTKRQNLNERPLYNVQKINDFEKHIGTFLWINNKIKNHKMSANKLKKLVTDIIHETGLDESLLFVTGLNKIGMENIIGELANEFIVLSDLEMKEKQVIKTDLPDNIDKFYKSFDISLKLKTLIDQLVSINIQGDAAFLLEEYKNVTGLGDNKRSRYLFNMPGSFKKSLKTVSDYLCNSLVFVYFMFRKEFKNGNISFDASDLLTKSIEHTDEFLKAYNTSLIIANDKSNQGETFLSRELLQYIPKDLAHLLIKTISGNCEFINELLLEFSVRISNSPLKKDKVLIKKLNIISSSFKDVSQKIMYEVAKLKLN